MARKTNAKRNHDAKADSGIRASTPVARRSRGGTESASRRPAAPRTSNEPVVAVQSQASDVGRIDGTPPLPPQTTSAAETPVAIFAAPAEQGEPSKAKPSSLAEMVGQGMAAFEDIVLPTPAQIECIRQMDTLRVMGLHQPAGQQRRAFRYLNQSGSGKSTCAKLLRKHVDAQPGRDPRTKPVLHVTLSTTGTPKSLATSILNAFGDGYSTRGEAEVLLERVKVLLDEFGVELLIIDELNHFKQKHLADDAANTIKNILTLGWVPIVLMGTMEAHSLFARNRELKNRCAPQVILQPFVHTDDASLAVWTELLHRMDLEMVERGILSETSGLGDPVLAEDLCEASNGIIGELHNILLAALESTLMAGESHISYDRLIEAIDAWCLQDETIGHNPLRLRRGK